jgi:hypothetical protein
MLAWVAMVLGPTGAVFLTRGTKLGYAIGFTVQTLSSILWMIVAYQKDLLPLLISASAFTIIEVIGIIRNWEGYQNVKD